MLPNPTRLRSVVKEEDVEKHRSVCCVEYDECLVTALRHSWRSWSCESCALFQLGRRWRAAEIAHAAALRPYASDSCEV